MVKEAAMKATYHGQLYHFKSFDELWRFYSGKLKQLKQLN